jgi:poly-gamma-glutamate synthesis protein (capsule biosynthesis protein)
MIQENNYTGGHQSSALLGFAGDTMLGRSVNRKIEGTSYLYPWGNLLSLLKKTDLNIINLETTLTESTEKVPKVFNFKAGPDKVKALLEAKIAIVTLANNHILDFAEKGLLETIEVLQKAGVGYVGAGKNLEEASRPIYTTINGIRIGILGYTDNEPGWKAGKHPGTNYIKIGVESIKSIENVLVKIKNKVDVLIVSIHWGPNMREKPSQQFIAFAHQLADVGVNIIHGHSAHIFQGIEVYKNSLILYDTGDFVDDYMVDPYLRNDRSFFFLCEIGKSGVNKLSLFPVLIKNMQVNLATGEDYSWCMRRIKKLSAEFGTVISNKGEIIING